MNPKLPGLSPGPTTSPSAGGSARPIPRPDRWLVLNERRKSAAAWSCGERHPRQQGDRGPAL